MHNMKATEGRCDWTLRCPVTFSIVCQPAHFLVKNVSMFDRFRPFIRTPLSHHEQFSSIKMTDGI